MYRRYAILIILTVLLAGCGGSSSQPTIPVVSTSASTASLTSSLFTAINGGNLEIPGGARVTVGAGSLPSDTRVSLTLLAASPQ